MDTLKNSYGENYLLYALYREPARLDETGNLTGHFTDDRQQFVFRNALYRAMRAAWEASEIVDDGSLEVGAIAKRMTDIVAAETGLNKDEAAAASTSTIGGLLTLFDVVTSHGISESLNIVKSGWQKRKLKEELLKVNETDPEGIPDYMEHLKDKIADLTNTNHPEALGAADYITKQMDADIDSHKTVYKTGYIEFDSDDWSGGGLGAGLHVIAAPSSLGKTTYNWQMADQMAKQGHHVIYFALEQGALELYAKSISRYAALIAQNKGVSLYSGKPSERYNPITSGQIVRGLNNDAVKEARKRYLADVENRLTVVSSGLFSTTVSDIVRYVKRYIRKHKTQPVVFVDYIQAVQGEMQQNGRTPDIREIVDNTVHQLRAMAFDEGIPVIAISSMNRSNYKNEADFEGLKESGGIEFTADSIFMLQLEAVHDAVNLAKGKENEKRRILNSAKAEIPRKLELVKLKYRYGKCFDVLSYDYDPRCDCFFESGIPKDFYANPWGDIPEGTEVK